MNDTGIQRVTEAIRTRLVDALLDATEDRIFVGPLHDEGANGAWLVLFLYRVVPNADLRNAHHLVPQPDPTKPPIDYDNALPVDLHYILTAGGRQDGGEPDSLARLGRAMQALNDRPLFSGTLLDNEVVRLTLCPATSEELSRVWALFPDQNYRTSLLYLASPVWIDPAQQLPAATPVVTTPHRIGPTQPVRAA